VSAVSAVLVLALTAYILGRTLARRVSFASSLERAAVSTALGLAAVSLIAFFLGLLGLLARPAVLVLLAGIHLLGIPAWRELVWKRVRLSVLLGGIVALGPLAILAAYPPTGFDATLYHLPFARAFVETGGLPWLPDLRFPVFPQANEVLFAVLMLFAPDLAAHGLQLLMTLLTAALVLAWGRDAFPERGGAAGWLAAAVFLGNPIVVHLGASAYVESGLGLFVTAALYAAYRWMGFSRCRGGACPRPGGGGPVPERGRGQAPPLRTDYGEGGWLALAAFFAGSAAATKYLGLFFLGVIGLLVVFSRLPVRTLRARTWDVLLFTGVALAVLVPWYGRIYLSTGNPLFPYFPQTFGENPWSPIHFRDPLGFAGETARLSPVGNVLRRVVEVVRLPWDLIFERATHGQQPPFSPAYLALLPVALWAAVKDCRLRPLLGVAALYALACTSLPADGRYVVPVLPLLSLAVAGALFKLPIPQWQGVTATLCLAFFLPGWLYAGYRIYRQGPLPVTAAGREAYLARKLPLYAALSDLNRRHGSGYTLWALRAEQMSYFAAGRFLGDWYGPASYPKVLAASPDAESLHRTLRSRGVDHLLLTSEGGLPFPEDARFLRWFVPEPTDGAARVYELKGE